MHASRHAQHSVICAFGAVILLIGCRPCKPGDIPDVSASGVRYTGTGEFFRDGDLTQRSFGIKTRASEPPPYRSVHLRSRGYAERLPAPGIYALRVPAATGAPEPGFTATYSQPLPGGGGESYVAHSGELHITRSSPRCIAGTFRFIAVRYGGRVLGQNRPLGSGDPAQVEASAPTVHVSGTFAARRAPDIQEAEYAAMEARP